MAIFFYNKSTGEIFATIDGRVHDKKQMECIIGNGIGKEKIGKYIIGWEETDETEMVEREVEKLIEIKKDLFKKVKVKEKIEVPIKKEHNMDKFELLQKFEDNSPTNPLKYKVTGNNLVKMIK
jgi:hypothetical protein